MIYNGETKNEKKPGRDSIMAEGMGWSNTSSPKFEFERFKFEVRLFSLFPYIFRLKMLSKND